MEGEVDPPPISTNDSLSNSAMTEFLQESFRDMNQYFYLILITLFCTLITILIAIVHMFYISKYVSLRRLRNNLYYVVALNPVCSLCCLFAMIMPRNLAFLQGVILTYQMLALRTAIDVLFNISGGRRQLSDKLKDCKESIKYKAFPLCCCACLPVIAPSVRNIRKLENIISQTCVVRVVLQVADICVMRETGDTHNWWFVSSYFLSFITMTVALYFSCVVANLNRDIGNRFRYNYLFYAVNISQILYTSQRTLFSGVKYLMEVEKDSFAKSLIDYDYFLETYYLMFVFSVEVALMSIIISIIMRPGVTYMFDSYSFRSNSTKFLPLEPSGRGDFESKEEVKDEQKKIEAKKDEKKESIIPTSPMGPDTVMKTLGRDQTEPKKAKNPAAVEDDGNYENLITANDQDLKKVLKNMEKK